MTEKEVTNQRFPGEVQTANLSQCAASNREPTHGGREPPQSERRPSMVTRDLSDSGKDHRPDAGKANHGFRSSREPFFGMHFYYCNFAQRGNINVRGAFVTGVLNGTCRPGKCPVFSEKGKKKRRGCESEISPALHSPTSGNRRGWDFQPASGRRHRGGVLFFSSSFSLRSFFCGCGIGDVCLVYFY